MNNILQLKGRFDQRPNSSRPGSPKLPKGKNVKSSHLKALAEQLQNILSYWQKNTDIKGALVSVHYKHVVAKSNRIQAILAEGGKSPAESIRGAKFVWEKDRDGRTIQKHVFTHFVKLETLKKSIELLEKAAMVLETQYRGNLTSEECAKIANKKEIFYDEIMSKSAFLKIIVDGNYVERFDIDRADEEITQDSIITIYQTGVETKELLEKFGIHIVDDRIINKTTLRLTPDEAKLLYNHASYLVAMSLTDFAEISRDDISDEVKEWDDDTRLIPKPSIEPVIGVIDTQFNENVYFKDWVDYTNMLDENIPLSKEDYKHGTAVSYIIVDGPQGNPDLDDGCGRFRVRHFGVATHNGFSSFAVLRLIRDIVAKNRDIKVWNLSLGSKLEIKPNFISPEAAELDRIQSEYDVIFVVAGTNVPKGVDGKNMKIGSPADSLNSLVVNSVDFKGKSASYTRSGPVLSFFHKPDLSYYGGDGNRMNEKIAVCCDDMGAAYVSGTSFAAPWVSRKLAYLIHIMGLSRELAKALLIDSAAKWDRKDDISHRVGYGILPKHIRDIIHSPDDEIRFLMMGASEEYETYTYNLPVPVVNNAHPFYAKATLVYFPQCNRNQGVDYTSTEMDIHFGRIVIDKKNKTTIKSIDNNKQSEEGLITLYEEDARRMYRKWDNVKHISEKIKDRAVPRKAYDSGSWGLSIKTKERTTAKTKEPLQFGVVVTLKEMNGVNRIDDFVKMCMARGWLVNKLDVQNQIDVYMKAEEEITFE